MTAAAPDTSNQAAPGVRAAWISWTLLAAFSFGIVALIIGAPLAQANGHPQFASAIYRTFSYVCHQLPERSFHVSGHQFGVCSRCTGLYTGVALAMLSYPLVRSLRSTDAPSRLWLILAAAPLAIDFLLGYFGIWENTHLTRFVTGALLGSVAIFFIMPGVVQLSQMISRKLAAKASKQDSDRNAGESHKSKA